MSALPFQNTSPRWYRFSSGAPGSNAYLSKPGLLREPGGTEKCCLEMGPRNYPLFVLDIILALDRTNVSKLRVSSAALGTLSAANRIFCMARDCDFLAVT